MVTLDSQAISPRSGVTCARVSKWVEGGNTASMRSLPHNPFKSLVALDDMRLLLNKAYHLDLKASRSFRVRDLEKNVKQFCGELLDRCTPNPWKTAFRLSHLSLRTRMSIASSIFSVRKLLSPPKPRWEDYVNQMTSESLPVDGEFAMFCSRELHSIFEVGWDRGYWSQVKSFTPPNKSNIRKKEIGSYREFATNDSESRDRFLRWCGGTVTDPIPRDVRATAVFTGGKWRVITLSDHRLSHLLPLHRTLYNRISKEKWLLRGEATPMSFSEFGRRDGELFVSGDYESATDNLNKEISQMILRVILSRATHVPSRVREEALDSLTMNFVDASGNHLGVQSKGQLMGSPLSFPLLCIVNYLTFRYAVRRQVPVKINGDDIVFRANRQEIDRWFTLVSKSGLKVSVGKTLVHRTVFSLNSSYFAALDMGATAVPHFRASNIFKECEDMTSLAGRVAQIKRDLPVGAIRCIALKTVLRRNFKVIYSSQGSFSRRYAVSIPGSVLRCLRLSERESFYRGLPDEPMPLEKYTGIRQAVVPDGWKKSSAIERGFTRVIEDEISETFVERSWSSPFVKETRDEYWLRVRDGSFRFVPFRKKTYQLYAKFAGRVFMPTSHGVFHREEGYWVKPVSEGPMGPVAFRSGGLLKDQE